MKKILNKKFIIGFLFIVVSIVILISSNVLKVNAGTGVVAGTVEVSAYAGSSTLSYPNSGTTITWNSNGDSCTFQGVSYGPSNSSGVPTGSLGLGVHRFTVNCTKADPIVQCNSYYVPLSACFIANTKVTMADGTIKNIQDVKIGDVLKGESTDNKVLGFHQPKLDGKLYSFNGGRYFVTEEHPFKTINGWKSINPNKTANENIGITVTKLKVGDTLITENGYVLLKTINSKVGKDDTQLYNFKLDGDHTYYADGYLVHNKFNCSVGYSCGSWQVCLADVASHCSGTVVGSHIKANGAGGVGPYEGYDCSYFDQTACNAGWITHGCSWVTASYSCASCPGSCQSGYTASCSGGQTLCTENTPCSGGSVN